MSQHKRLVWTLALCEPICRAPKIARVRGNSTQKKGVSD
jgi:hypothetical protein